jgi:hypothetical protein
MNIVKLNLNANGQGAFYIRDGEEIFGEMIIPYVHAQFKRHSEEYVDIWEKQIPDHQ